jgi:hypothetical protein
MLTNSSEYGISYLTAMLLAPCGLIAHKLPQALTVIPKKQKNKILGTGPLGESNANIEIKELTIKRIAEPKIVIALADTLTILLI